MNLISGPGNYVLSKNISRTLNIDAINVQFRKFPDGESYLRISKNWYDDEIVLLHSISPPQDTKLIQLLFLIDKIKKESVNKLTVICPYLAYARQDRSRIEDEVVSIFSLIRLFELLKINKLITINVHNSEVFKNANFNFVDINAISFMAEYMKDNGYSGSYSLSLGKKPSDIKHAEDANKILKGGCSRLLTFRDAVNGEVTLGKIDFDIRDKCVIIFDDVITSGNTHLKATELLRKHGASEVHVACVHSLITKKNLEKIVSKFNGFICTNTIQNKFSKVDVSPLISNVL
jgi:ribose-phosphate pyrophosphokinase